MPTLDRILLQQAAVNLETMAREYEDRATLTYNHEARRRELMEKFTRLHRLSNELTALAADDRI